MKPRMLVIAVGCCVVAGVTQAAPHTVTLAVQNMTSAVCPLTVKKALERVPGVQHVVIDYASKTVTVQFDDANSTVEKLTEATTNAGFPSTVTGNNP